MRLRTARICSLANFKIVQMINSQYNSTYNSTYLLTLNGKWCAKNRSSLALNQQERFWTYLIKDKQQSVMAAFLHPPFCYSMAEL